MDPRLGAFHCTSQNSNVVTRTVLFFHKTCLHFGQLAYAFPALRTVMEHMPAAGQGSKGDSEFVWKAPNDRLVEPNHWSDGALIHKP